MAVKKKKKSKKNIDEAKRRSLANLRPAKPGEIRNPHGRPPKERCIPDLLRKYGKEVIQKQIKRKKYKLTRWELYTLLVWTAALDGRPWAIQFIADRTEGKPLQSHEISGKKGSFFESLFDMTEEEIKKFRATLAKRRNGK